MSTWDQICPEWKIWYHNYTKLIKEWPFWPGLGDFSKFLSFCQLRSEGQTEIKVLPQLSHTCCFGVLTLTLDGQKYWKSGESLLKLDIKGQCCDIAICGKILAWSMPTLLCWKSLKLDIKGQCWKILAWSMPTLLSAQGITFTIFANRTREEKQQQENQTCLTW